jgi:hypothetical protein
MASWQMELLRTGSLRSRLPAPHLPMPLVSHCGAAFLGLSTLQLQPHFAMPAVGRTVTIHNDASA